MRLSLSLRLGLLASFGVFAVAACSSGTTTGFGPDGGTAEEAGSSGSSGTSGSSGSSGTSGSIPDAATSCFDPSCPIALCQCKDKTFYSPTGICKEGGKCAVVAACEDACGTAGFSGGVFENKPCTDNIQCSSVVSQPTISCSCNAGFGSETYPACNAGHCSTAPEHACPKACSSQGGWTCKSGADCAPIVCACKDGKNPVAGSPCSGSSCSSATAVCPAACGTHGGWAGSPTPPPDAGPTGPKQPGEACTTASECQPFNCACNNGNTFNNNKSCQNKICPTKAQACNLSCTGNGGWTGT